MRTPSGISYVLENRVAMTRLVPELFAQYRVRPVDHYPQLLLAALRAVAPSAEDEATVVVWTPGPVQLRLLRARLPRAPDGRRAGRGVRPRRARRRPLHAHDRRPRARARRLPPHRRRLHRPARVPPRLAARRPGPVRAYRAGTVAIANAVGTGVADDKAIYHYVPEMIRFYLGEEPILANVPDLPALRPRAARARARAPRRARGQADRRVGRQGRLHRPARRRRTSSTGLADVIRADPERWIAQELVQPLDGARPRRPTGALAPRHVDLRPFAVFGEDIKIVPGGLTRVALSEGSMIVNSSRGGGSKDTWVLEDGQDTDRAEPEGDARGRRRRCPTCATAGRVGRPATAAAAVGARPDRPRAVLARAQPRARRAHRAHARRRLPGRAAGPARRPRRRHARLGLAAGDHGRARPATAPARRDEVLRALTLEPDNPTSVIACVGRAREGARTVRDVISAEMWEAINTTNLALVASDLSARLRTGPYSVYAYVKERCALFWGLTVAHDAARRGVAPSSPAGGRIESADMVLRMLRVALPPDVRSRRARPSDGQALALLQAVGGFQAYRRAVPAPPNALPGRALPALRAHLPGLGRGLGRRRCTTRSPRRRQPAQLRAGAAPAAPERRPRVPRRAPQADGGDLHADAARRSRRSSARVDRDIAERYFAGARRAADGRAYELRHPLPDRVPLRGPVTDNLNALRVRPATTSTQRVDDFHVRVDPEARLQRHLDYFGTEVIEFGVAQPHDHLSIDVRARVVTRRAAAIRRTSGWEALEAALLRGRRRRVPALRRRPSPRTAPLDELVEASRATSPLATLRLLCRARSPTASSTARA